MTNKTQCPKCQTVYLITDEQLLQSRGKVRCGACKTPFQAQFVDDIDQAVVASAAAAADSPTAKPSIPSDNLSASEQPGSINILRNTRAVPDEVSPDNFVVPKSFLDEAEAIEHESEVPVSIREDSGFKPAKHPEGYFEPIDPLAKKPLASLTQEPVKARTTEPAIDPSQDVPQAPNYKNAFEDNLNSELTIEIDDDEPAGSISIDGVSQDSRILDRNEDISVPQTETLNNDQSDKAELASDFDEDPLPEPIKGYLPDPDEDSLPEPIEGYLPESAEDSLQEPAEGSLPEPVEDSLSEPVEDSLSEPAEGSLPEPAEGSLPEPAEGSLPESVEDSLPEPVEDSLPEPVEDSLPEPVEDSLPEPVEDSLPEPVEDSLPEPVEDSLPEPVEDSLPEPVEDSLPEPVEDSLSEPAEGSLLNGDQDAIEIRSEPIYDGHGVALEDPNTGSSENSVIAAKTDDQALISEVDQLIGEKLISDAEVYEKIIEPNLEPTHEPALAETEFSLATTSTSGSLNRWVFGPATALFGIFLLAGLLYQLWLKQAIPDIQNTAISETVAPVIGFIKEPLTEQLDQLTGKFDIELPVRRDIGSLQLLSARIGEHPTRPSTTLLRVGIINHSKISQPFPWIEVVLSDENGRLVARRALSPDDYTHNNRLENSIGSNELKPVTIELLSFPKQAHGYELRLLNR